MRSAICAALCGVFTAFAMASASIAQPASGGGWELSGIEDTAQWAWLNRSQTKPEAVSARQFHMGWTLPNTNRVVALNVNLVRLPLTFNFSDSDVELDAVVTSQVTGPGAQTATVRCTGEASSDSSGFVARDIAGEGLGYQVPVGQPNNTDCAPRIGIGSNFPRANFTLHLAVTIDDGGPRWAREPSPHIGVLTILLHYRWTDSPSPPDAGAQRGLDVSGVWDTDFGRLTLTRASAGVIGDYTSPEGRIVSAPLSGALLGGVWIQSSSGQRCQTQQQGSFYWGRFAFAFSGNAFQGKWSYCDQRAWSGAWNGHRTSAGHP
jgi:hypothetical protein